jgi:outer membrane protein TolC
MRVNQHTVSKIANNIRKELGLQFIFKLCMILLCVISSVPCDASVENDKPRVLTLREAILLAVKRNPNVKISQLNQVLQNFSLEVELWRFKPHYSFQATRTTSRTYSVTPAGYVTSNVSGVQPAASLLTPLGTQITLTSTNNVANNYNPGLSLQVIQPLLRGFGRPIVETELYNALDNEHISRLNVLNGLRNTITAVIDAYLDVMLAQKTLEVDSKALRQAELSVEQTKLFFKAGHKAGMEIVTVKASIANLKTTFENDKNSLEQSRYALLTAIGIDPDANIIFKNIDIQELIQRYHIPTLVESKSMGLENDIQYQITKIMLQGAMKRAVLVAENNTRWQLDLIANASVGNGTGGGQYAGINSIVNGVNRNVSASLNLTIPIDDLASQNSLASAKIALQESRIVLQQQKWNIQTNIINAWKNIPSAERALFYARDAENLQNKTYHISYQKYSFGLIDSLQLQTAQQDLISTQKSLLDNQIAYLKALVNLDNLTGMTLKTWNVTFKSFG